MVVVDQKHCFHSDDVISYSYPTTLSTQLNPFLGMCRRSMKSCVKKFEKSKYALVSRSFSFGSEYTLLIWGCPNWY